MQKLSITALLALLLAACSDPAPIQSTDKSANNNVKNGTNTSRSEQNQSGSKALIKKEQTTAKTKPQAKLLKLNRGQTLSDLLKGEGLNDKSIFLLARAVKPYINLNKMAQQSHLLITKDQHSSNLKFASNFAKLIDATWHDNKWQVSLLDVPTQNTQSEKTFSIDHSLYLDAVAIDVPVTVINQATLVLSHFIDFQRNIHKQDGLQLVYQQTQVTQYHQLFSHLATPYQLQQITFDGSQNQLALYRFNNSYYFEDGRLAQNFLMKTPLDGGRLSSYFGPRKHPILGYNRLHKGIDFGAPIGTPIMAAGNGTIKLAGKKGTFGNCVIIEHSGGYQTLYAHLKGIAKGVKQGSVVNQGETIGYLGVTGLSQAPHLHYEVHKNGKAINPLELRQPSHARLTGEELVAFKQHLKTFYFKDGKGTSSLGR